MWWSCSIRFCSFVLFSSSFFFFVCLCLCLRSRDSQICSMNKIGLQGESQMKPENFVSTTTWGWVRERGQRPDTQRSATQHNTTQPVVSFPAQEGFRRYKQATAIRLQQCLSAAFWFSSWPYLTYWGSRRTPHEEKSERNGSKYFRWKEKGNTKGNTKTQTLKILDIYSIDRVETEIATICGRRFQFIKYK